MIQKARLNPRTPSSPQLGPFWLWKVGGSL